MSPCCNGNEEGTSTRQDQLRTRLDEIHQVSRKDAQSSIIDQPNEEFARSVINEPNTLLPEISLLQGNVQIELFMPCTNEKPCYLGLFTTRVWNLGASKWRSYFYR